MILTLEKSYRARSGAFLAFVIKPRTDHLGARGQERQRPCWTGFPITCVGIIPAGGVDLGALRRIEPSYLRTESRRWPSRG